MEDLFLKNKKSLNSLLDKAGKDLAPMLFKSIEGKISSWAVKCTYTQIKRNAYCVLPVRSLVKNIGADASGTNFNRNTKRYDVELETEIGQFDFTKNVKINEEILEQIRKLVQPGIVSYIKYRLFNLY